MDNIFTPFSAEVMAAAFGLKTDTVLKLKLGSTKQGTLLGAVQGLVGVPPINI